jgi:hypothetical protein
VQSIQSRFEFGVWGYSSFILQLRIKKQLAH